MLVSLVDHTIALRSMIHFLTNLLLTITLQPPSKAILSGKALARHAWLLLKIYRYLKLLLEIVRSPVPGIS